jgi:hypothetical protein
MTLDEWLIEERARLDRFEAECRKRQAKEPQHWPAEMEASLWDEAFLSFAD